MRVRAGRLNFAVASLIGRREVAVPLHLLVTETPCQTNRPEIWKIVTSCWK